MCSLGYRYRLSPTRPAKLCSSCIGLSGRRNDAQDRPLLLRLTAGGNHWRTFYRRRMSLPRMSAPHGRALWRQRLFREDPGSTRRSEQGLHPERPGRPEAPVSFLSRMRHHRLLGGRFPARPNRRCGGDFRRSCFSRPDEIGLGGISAFMGRLRARSRAVPTSATSSSSR